MQRKNTQRKQAHCNKLADSIEKGSAFVKESNWVFMYEDDGVITGCALFMALVDFLGSLEEAVEQAKECRSREIDHVKFIAKLFKMPFRLVDEVDTLHCSEEISAKNIISKLRAGEIDY